jgi:hypothetical protein
MFSLNWFKNFLKEETPVAKPVVVTTPVENFTKPYKNVKLVNDVITVVLNDGNIITKSDVSEEDFMNVRNAQSEIEVFNYLKSKVKTADIKEEQHHHNQTSRDFTILTDLTDDFEIKENGTTVYLKGIDRSLPSLLVDKFCDILTFYRNEPFNAVKEDEEYVALKRFFMWCCLNPRAEVVDKLYGFLSKNGMKITKQGFFVGLRNVVKVNDSNPELVDAITNAYHKVKAVWKKNPDNYRIVENNGQYSIEKVDTTPHGAIVGNLTSLYLNLPNMAENRYTDEYSRTFDIRIGQVVSMKPEDCSWSTADCAEKGLHFAGYTAPYVLCGDTTVFTLHNPMKVVGIGSEKGRCYEYLPFMTTNVQEADEIMNSQDFDFLQLDEQYAINELENLEENVKNGFAKEACKYEFNIPSLSTIGMKNIISSLEEMKTVISKRVILSQ